MKRIAINGLENLGRTILKRLSNSSELELVVVNSHLPLDNIVHLLTYDVRYGRYEKEVYAKDGDLIVDGQRIAYRSEKNPAVLWKTQGVDLIVDTEIVTTKGNYTDETEKQPATVWIGPPEKNFDKPKLLKDDHELYAFERVNPSVEVWVKRINVGKAVLTGVHAYIASMQAETSRVMGSLTTKFEKGEDSLEFSILPNGKRGKKINRKGNQEGLSVIVSAPLDLMSEVKYTSTRGDVLEYINAILDGQEKSMCCKIPRFYSLCDINPD